MTFREAIVADIPQIQEVRHSVKENVLSDPSLVTDEDCAEYMTVRGKGWVCVDEGAVVGFSIADLEEDNIWALFVRPEYEGRGVGRTLHDLMMDWYFSQGKETVWLGTAPQSRAAVFYRKAGWRETGTHGKNEIRFEMTADEWRERRKNALQLEFIPFPRIQTERLILRSLQEDDAPGIFLIRSNNEVNLHLDRQPATSIDDAVLFIRRVRSGLEKRSAVLWAIVPKNAAGLAGTIVLWNISEEKKQAEIGYELLPQFQGKGYGAEAVSAVLQYGFGQMKLERVEAFTRTGNEASVRLLLKFGFERDVAVEESLNAEEKHPDTIVYSLPRARYQMAKNRAAAV